MLRLDEWIKTRGRIVQKLVNFEPKLNVNRQSIRFSYLKMFLTRRVTTLESFMRGGSSPISDALPFYIPFLQKRHPFRIPFIEKKPPPPHAYFRTQCISFLNP